MISVRLKELQERKGLTQDELARRINTSRSNIANYENNKNLPSIEILKGLANELGCSIDYLLEETKNRIKQLRQEFNYTQQELADKLGLKGKSTIAMYENGNRKPSYLILTKMSKLFSCSIDYIVGNSECRGGQEMGIFTEMTAIEKRMLEIKELAKETLDKMVEMKMTHDDYDYFKHTLDNFVSKRQIGGR